MENTKQTQYHAAAYVRLSKEDLNSVSGLKAESNSISNQKQLILDYLKDKTDINPCFYKRRRWIYRDRL